MCSVVPSSCHPRGHDGLWSREGEANGACPRGFARRKHFHCRRRATPARLCEAVAFWCTRNRAWCDYLGLGFTAGARRSLADPELNRHDERRTRHISWFTELYSPESGWTSQAPCGLQEPVEHGPRARVREKLEQRWPVALSCTFTGLPDAEPAHIGRPARLP